MKLEQSRRQCQVLYLMVRGRTRQEIADQLELSVWTIQDYVKRIRDRIPGNIFEYYLAHQDEIDEVSQL